MLYALCVYILVARKNHRYWVHVIFVTILYVASTIGMGLKSAIYAIEGPEELLQYTLNLPLVQDSGLTPEQQLFILDLKQVLRTEYET